MSESILKKGKVKFLTLGCRLNQYETQAMREKLALDGYEDVEPGEVADVFVINTCTVTNDADRDSRYLIRKCHRENPNAKVVVTGCYAEKDYKQIQKIEGVSHILLNRQKSDIAQLLDSCTQLTFDAKDYALRSKSEFVPLEISEFAGKKRAYIKVQDGCNHACSFCKVVLVRGKSKSREMVSVIEEAKRLSEKNHQEVVLTGVQLGAYGLDFEPKTHLVELIRELIKLKIVPRIRLSSIEPTDVTDELIELMAEHPEICPHLHIPLQSGSSDILQGMNRRYNSVFFRELIARIKSRVKNFILTTDVMVGFPGESDVLFQETVETLVAVQPFKMHIFPYSARQGTKAFGLQSVDGSIIEERMYALAQLEEKLRTQVQREYIGSVLDVLVEEQLANGDFEGRAANYLPVHIHADSGVSCNTMVSVKIDELKDSYLFGHTVGLNNLMKGHAYGVAHGHH